MKGMKCTWRLALTGKQTNGGLYKNGCSILITISWIGYILTRRDSQGKGQYWSCSALVLIIPATTTTTTATAILPNCRWPFENLGRKSEPVQLG